MNREEKTEREGRGREEGTGDTEEAIEVADKMPDNSIRNINRRSHQQTCGGRDMTSLDPFTVSG
jgi:hypothetical protein